MSDNDLICLMPDDVVLTEDVVVEEPTPILLVDEPIEPEIELIAQEVEIPLEEEPATTLEFDWAGFPIRGLNAYQLALRNGFVGTEAEWLQSLVGPENENAPLAQAAQAAIETIQADINLSKAAIDADVLTIQNYVCEAKCAAQAAQASATAAAQSEADAASQADRSMTYANEAETFAERAETAYGLANASAGVALDAKNHSEASAVSSATHALEAEGWSNQAGNYASASETASLQAQAFRDDAESFSQAAHTSRDQAQAFADNSQEWALASSEARNEAQTARSEAESFSEDAASAVTTAQAAAAEATSQAGLAVTAANQADESAEAAVLSASQANSYSDLSQTYSDASYTSSLQAQAYRDDAEAYAEAAATSSSEVSGYVDDAEAAAAAATTAKVAAEAARDTAAGSASAANTSATNASASATAAGTSATTATTQAGVATTKAGEASTSAGNAATSATNAAGSASTAMTQAGLAATARSDAQGYATAANTSAGNASSSATAAGNSATASQTAKLAAEAARDTASGYASAANTSAVNASNSASSAATSATLAASFAASGNYFNKNGTFSVYTTTPGLPNDWNNWENGTGATRVANRYPAWSAYAAQLTSTAGANAGWACAVFPANAGWYVIEADIRLVSGTLVGAGVGFFGASEGLSLSFSADKTTNEVIPGAGTAGEAYSYRKLIQKTTADTGNTAIVYVFTAYSGLGSTATARTIIWDRVGVRPASSAEIAAQRADTVSAANTATITANATTAANATAAVAIRTTTLEAITKQGNPNLLRNSDFSALGRFWQVGGTAGTTWNYYLNPYLGQIMTASPVAVDSYIYQDIDWLPTVDCTISGEGDWGNQSHIVYIQFLNAAKNTVYYQSGSLNITSWDTRARLYVPAAPTGTAYLRFVIHAKSTTPASLTRLMVQRANVATSWNNTGADSDAVARVAITESAISTINGKVAAYWQVATDVGLGLTYVRVASDTIGGAITMAADNIAMYNRSAGTLVEVLKLTDGNAYFAHKVYVGPSGNVIVDGDNGCFLVMSGAVEAVRLGYIP